MPKKTEIDHYSDKEALDFHIKGKSGKIEINSSKPLITKRDLSLAYSPGVAAPVKEIAKNPDLAYDYTSKGNLVAVISNGSAILGLVFTLGLAVLFTMFQVYEYKHASFTMSDGIYGSTFYMATGFHGFHVQIGTIFLAVCLVRLYHHHFTREAHFGFEAAAWYWHFVDVVWLFLFVAVYWWGGV